MRWPKPDLGQTDQNIIQSIPVNNIIMKTSIFLSALFLSTMFLTSCSDDLAVEPAKTEKTNTNTYETEYQVNFDVQSSFDLLRPTDERQGSETLHFAGQGFGSSATFGDVSTTVDLYYGLEDGVFYGTVTLDIRNSSEKLELRISHKNDVRAWSDLSDECLSAVSAKQFASMDFNGEMCLTDFPSDIVEIGNRQVSFSINGSLK